MRIITTIVLMSLILSPILWNGIGLVHYLVEHTHTFCLNEEDHDHQPVDECDTMCSLPLEHNQDVQHPPQPIEYQEIKQYFPPTISYQAIQINSNSPKMDFSPSHNGQMFIKEIFHPPTC